MSTDSKSIKKKKHWVDEHKLPSLRLLGTQTWPCDLEGDTASRGCSLLLGEVEVLACLSHRLLWGASAWPAERGGLWIMAARTLLNRRWPTVLVHWVDTEAHCPGSSPSSSNHRLQARACVTSAKCNRMMKSHSSEDKWAFLEISLLLPQAMEPWGLSIHTRPSCRHPLLCAHFLEEHSTISEPEITYHKPLFYSPKPGTCPCFCWGPPDWATQPSRHCLVSYLTSGAEQRGSRVSRVRDDSPNTWGKFQAKPQTEATNQKHFDVFLHCIYFR